jgi:hypothetical protein
MKPLGGGRGRDRAFGRATTFHFHLLFRCAVVRAGGRPFISSGIFSRYLDRERCELGFGIDLKFTTGLLRGRAGKKFM